ncbi:prolyl oligopeptidase family serine peptidase [Stieleria magnilauensis]|uniref:Alpha/beta hydrolase fold protein n=1 Tax=Stieleria magnilauensis TaxID=2527963 RepID=A0ABX5XPQ6_9BACT|nr:alpha/beta hydrolase fold protein [Planctomycetes bacterium TBK1r]
MKFPLLVALCLWMASIAVADGPADNLADSVRPIPPLGEDLDDAQSQQLIDACQNVRRVWSELLGRAEEKARSGNKWQRAQHQQTLQTLSELTPEILVFPRAVELALEFKQFYQPNDFNNAVSLLEEAKRRIDVAGVTPQWSRVVGIGDGESQQLIIGGYQSKIDRSYQPYAVVVPAGYTHGDSRPRRLDIWFHGRGETLSEVSFLAKGRTSAGQYTPADTFVLHPYGRYSNAFKFAGEVDVLEALEHVRDHLPVDRSRTSVRGFSMGGAACWQFATHYADRFFAANPGAGFSETPEFLKSFQGEDLSSTPDYQRTLWRLYDCPHWSRNLVHCPTVAYSGEIDRQKQAADVMEASLARHGIDLVHVIGPQTAHKIHEDSKVEIEARMNALAASVQPTVPRTIDFTTQTLRYNRMHWVTVDGLKKHWDTAHVQAKFIDAESQTRIAVETSNVTHLRLDFAPGQWPGRLPERPIVVIDGSECQTPAVRSDRSWSAEFVRRDGRWLSGKIDEAGVRKRPGLQGPIDDAFMDSFLFVLPSKPCDDPALQAWVAAEAEHAQLHWRKHFRGDVQRVLDRQLTKEQIATHHLVLFGDPESNSVIARLADALPVKWNNDTIELGSKTWPRKAHAVAMIYPNPLSPDRYVVLNSGFTFREYDYLNNARQTPKLPDWAILEIDDGATMRDPGNVEAAGFFDERWKP